MLGGTVYTFSIILAVFLLGLGIGSSAGSFLARGTARPRLALGCCQLLLAATIAWTAWMLAESLPYWPIKPELSTSPWFNFQLDLARCLWAVLLPATFLGGEFSAGLGGHRVARAGPGTDGRGSLCGQHGRRDRRRHRVQHVLDRLGGDAAMPASADCIVGGGRADCARAAGPAAAVKSALGQPAGGARARDRGHGVVGGLSGAGGPVVLERASSPQGADRLWRTLATEVSEDEYGREGVESKIVYVGEGMNSSVAVTEVAVKTPTKAIGVSTSAARWKRPASRRTCECSGCWGTSRHCCTRSRGRCSWSGAARGSRPERLPNTRTSSES